MAPEEELHQPKKTKTSPEDPLSVFTLPNEIIAEILSRLPVKSLLRYKSICKLWRTTISDPYFIKSHLSLSRCNPHYAQLILSIGEFNINLLNCGLYEVICDHKSVNVLELDYPFKPSSYYCRIVGSCNGLLCIDMDGKSLYIWNPSTRKLNMFPCSGIKVGIGCYVMYAFGYDESNDDYNVVEISVNRNDNYDTEVKIYKMKSGYWKKLGKFPCGVPSFREVSGIYLNGALHWGTIKHCGSWTIVSLHLAKETYNEILPPVDDKDSRCLTSEAIFSPFSYTCLTLGALGEWLCVLYDYWAKHADVWVMKVYGLKDSWTRLVSIPYLVRHVSIYDSFSVPVYFSNDGKFLLKYSEKWVMYDSKNSSFSDIQKFDACLGAYTFVESLVSPHALYSDDNVN